jgi:hypothetical protein
MALNGTLDTMSVCELLRWAHAGRKTGSLEVERDGIARCIVFRRGKVVACSSNDPSTLIGQFLLSRGEITERVLRDAMARQAQSKQNLGVVLAEMGAVSDEQLARFVEAKVEESIFGIFDWDEAVFRFYVNEMPVHVVEVDLEVQEILERGERRRAETTRALEIIGDMDGVLELSGGGNPSLFPDDPLARNVIEQIDGKRTVGEIVLHSRGSPFGVLRILASMIENGLVGPARKVDESDMSGVFEETLAELAAYEAANEPPADRTGPEPGRASDTDSAPEPEAEAEPEPADGAALNAEMQVALQMMEDGNPEAALDLLNAMLRAHPGDTALQSLLSTAEQSFQQQMLAGELAATRVPVLLRALDDKVAAVLTAEESFLVKSIDGTIDIQGLIWVAPLQEVDVLRSLKRLSARGFIELKEPPEASTGS